jgi:hypothetical protein
MKNISKTQGLQIFGWALSGLVTVPAVVAWWGSYNGNISTNQLFPLFGLLAFSLMWVHYIVAVLRVHFKVESKALAGYFEVTSLIVLAAILLHPGLLVWQLWRDGLGLPPQSLISAYGESVRVAIIAGSISWWLFLAYEFRRKFKQRSWWKYVQYASDVGMLLIFVHALRLGTQLQSGWYQTVWYFYGLTLILSLGYLYGVKQLKPPVVAKKS